jgi:virulence-associated protein VapD
MYAIAFDLDTETLAKNYPSSSWQNGYHDVRRILEDEGFTWRQGSVYLGDATIDPVRCALVAQRLTRELPWFAAVARDVRMLRIEENNDLGPGDRRDALIPTAWR